MNNLNLFVARQALTTPKGQQLIAEQLEGIAKLATDPEVIQGVIAIGTQYISALTKGYRALSDDDRKAIVGAIVELLGEVKAYQTEIERLAEAGAADLEAALEE